MNITIRRHYTQFYELSISEHAQRKTRLTKEIYWGIFNWIRILVLLGLLDLGIECGMCEVTPHNLHM